MRTMVLVVMVVLFSASCSDGTSSAPDAAVSIPVADGAPEQCGPNAQPSLDVFGESCHADPFPANTLCHGGAGWCIDGSCRRMCSNECRRCPSGGPHYAAAGGCYCLD